MKGLMRSRNRTVEWQQTHGQLDASAAGRFWRSSRDMERRGRGRRTATHLGGLALENLTDVEQKENGIKERRGRGDAGSALCVRRRRAR